MFWLILPNSKLLQLLMPIHFYLRSQKTGNYFDNIISSKLFIQRFYYLQSLNNVVFSFHFFFRVFTVVAAFAIFCRVMFAEIAHERFSAADATLRISHS